MTINTAAEIRFCPECYERMHVTASRVGWVHVSTDTVKCATRHIITPKVSGRTLIECQRCGMGMEVGDSPLGAAMLENWPTVHKCPKGWKKE